MFCHRRTKIVSSLVSLSLGGHLTDSNHQSIEWMNGKLFFESFPLWSRIEKNLHKTKPTNIRYVCLTILTVFGCFVFWLFSVLQFSSILIRSKTHTHTHWSDEQKNSKPYHYYLDTEPMMTMMMMEEEKRKTYWLAWVYIATGDR